MTTESLVTIGLPCYNSQRFIRQSLESLLAQTYTNFRLIISDNASTDNTAAICKEFAARDARVVYSRNAENIGNPGNFNRIARMTTSKYLKWSTSDDYWAPTFLERAVEVMERDDSIVLCYPGAVLVDENGLNPKPYKDYLHLMQGDPSERFIAASENSQLVHQHLGLIRMSALLQTKLLGPFFSSDLYLIAELSLYGKFFELPEPLFFRRFHPGSGSWNRASAAHQSRYYHGKNTDTPFVIWRSQFWNFRSVLSAPISITAKTKAGLRVLKHLYWKRRDLFHDLMAGLRGQRLHRGV